MTQPDPTTEPWTTDDRLKPHAIPAATTPDVPPMTGGFDDSIEIPDLPAPAVVPPVDRAAVLREAAEICDEAAAVYAEKGANDPASGANTAAGALFALMERFLRKADEAEYVATPCSVGGCEPGGEPCSTHERLMAHAEGEHELCEPDCGGHWPRRMADETQPATGTDFVTRVLELFSLSHADAYGDLFWRVDDGEVRLYTNVSDVFAWGGSDCEDITPDTLPALEQAYTDLKAVGGEEFTAELYAARQRGMRPQGAAYPSGTHEAWRKVSALYDACGPARELGLGNPKAAPAHKAVVEARQDGATS